MKKTTTNSVGKNIAYQMAYRVITILTPLITSPILSRALGAERLGTYSATLTFANYFVLFSMLGVENYGNRSIAAVQDDAEKRRAMFWSIYAVQLAACVVSIAAYLFALRFVDSARNTISLLQGIWLISSLLNVNWYFFGTERFRLTVVRSIVVKFLAVLAIAFFVRRPEDLNLYAFIMSADAVLSCAILWPFLIRELGFSRPSRDSIREHIKPVFVLFVPILAITVFHVMDKSMLDMFSTENELGYYYSADKIAYMPLMAITAVSTVMLPRISNLYSSRQKDELEKLLKRSFELTVFLTCSIAVGIAAIAKEFIPFFFGPGFDPCILLVYWFTFVLFAKAFGDFIRMQYLIPARRDRLYTIAICAGAGLNLLLNLLLIPGHGALGAVWATLAAELAVTILQAFFIRDQVPFVRFLAANSPYLCFSAVMLVVVRFTAKHLAAPVWLKLICMICAGGLAYLACCLPYWKMNKNSAFHELSVFRKNI